MKTIGLLGGMSWESTILYYQRINECVRDIRGGLHSAQILMRSVDFAEIELLQREERWDEAGRALARSAAELEAGGADFVVLCTNTMHKVAGAIEAATGIPLLHIADVSGEALTQRGMKSVGLLGTRFTMEEPFYAERLRERYRISTLVPEEVERQLVNTIIYDELCIGRIEEASQKRFVEIGESLLAAGAECLLLGCTEIGLLIGSSSFAAPVFDTMELHVQAAVVKSLMKSARGYQDA